MKTLLVALLLCGAASTAFPQSINNDDSCDIKVGPAATLLLPYFEVDTTNPAGRTTLFTITNVTRLPQIAHVTLWSDWAFPVLTFNVFLTGYDVQSINLYDVIARGVIAPPNGTASATTPGALSASNSANGNIDPATLPCAGVANLPDTLHRAVQLALTVGVFNPNPGVGPACSTAGATHAHAIGYATIDIVSHCTNRLPTDALYYTTDLLFDNVLIGDYQQAGGCPAAQPGRGLPVSDCAADIAVGPGVNRFEAGGNPMVHIRAVPEGGGMGSSVPTGLPYTFYDRYTPRTYRTADRRQPLPATFAAHFIQGNAGAFATNLTVWREGFNSPGQSCSSYVDNAYLPFGEIIRFDEHENPSIQYNSYTVQPFFTVSQCCLPPVSSTNTDGELPSPYGDAYPRQIGPDAGGWMYLNLNNGGSTDYSVTEDFGFGPSITNGRSALAPAGASTYAGPRPSQNWVTFTMFGTVGANRLATELDAASLGNGCSPASFLTAAAAGPHPIAPAGGVFVCPPGTTLTNGTTALCTGTNANPNP